MGYNCFLMETKAVWKGLVFGGISASAAEIATFPIDSVKTRMQLQGELGKQRVYSNSLEAAVRITRTEGVSSLYKGLSPALLRQVLYGSLRYGLYGPIKRSIANASSEQSGLLVKVSSGAVAGALASSICNPTDLMKVRMQASSGHKYSGMRHAFSAIVREEGVRGLWRGTLPTCCRATALAAAELATYDEVTARLTQAGWFASQAGVHLSAALAAGFAATVASSPFDVIKSRIMNQPVDAGGQGLLYKGLLDCAAKSMRAEGFLSLYKGFWPNFGRIGPRVVIIFSSMEAMKTLMD